MNSKFHHRNVVHFPLSVVQTQYSLLLLVVRLNRWPTISFRASLSVIQIRSCSSQIWYYTNQIRRFHASNSKPKQHSCTSAVLRACLHSSLPYDHSTHYTLRFSTSFPFSVPSLPFTAQQRVWCPLTCWKWGKLNGTCTIEHYDRHFCENFRTNLIITTDVNTIKKTLHGTKSNV